MKSGWSLDVLEMSWVENTIKETEFIMEALGLVGDERVLDLACGFGRHSLDLARRGCSVVGVDFTEAYISHARSIAREDGLGNVDFLLGDVLTLSFREEFDVVLNMADGAIGYFDTEEENLHLFDVIASALKTGGQHAMGVCSAAYARRHFPRRNWQAGSQGLSLADFHWDTRTSRMTYNGRFLKYGEVLEPMSDEFPVDVEGTRLYTLEELEVILSQRGMRMMAAYGDYDLSVPASEDQLMQVVCSHKERSW